MGSSVIPGEPADDNPGTLSRQLVSDLHSKIPVLQANSRGVAPDEEVVSENLVDVGEVEGGIALGDFFGGAAVEGSHDQVEGYAGSSDAVDAVGVLRERNCFPECGHA